jgi:hypothetical protein
MANDGQDTWTWANRQLWTDKRLLGDPADLKDYKGPAFGMPAHDLLFVSSQGDVLEYRSALAGLSIPMLMVARQPCLGLTASNSNACYGTEPAGSLHHNTHLRSTLFNTNLYVHPRDTDDSPIENAYGFAWCGRRNVNVPFDDAAYFALGPSEGSTTELIQSQQNGVVTGGFSSNSSYYEVYVA